MPIQFRVQVGRSINLLEAITSSVKAPIKDVFSDLTFRKVWTAVAKADKLRFKRGSRRGGNWRRITIATTVFSRKQAFGKFTSRVTSGLLKNHANNMLPLRDTGRLLKSIAFPLSEEWFVRFTRRTFTVGTKVPYASKHITGKTVTFGFGPTNRKRLNERVPPPELIKKLKATKKIQTGVDEDGNPVFSKVFKGRIPKKAVEERLHYRLKTWAKQSYPRARRIPKRSWIGPLPLDVAAKMSETFQDDIAFFIRKKRRSGRR